MPVIRTSWSNTNLGELASLQSSLDLIQRGLPKSRIYLWPARKNDAYVEAVKGNYTTLNFIDGNINDSIEADNQNLADILSNIYQSNQQGGRQRFFYLPRSSQQSRAGAITGTITVSAYPRTNSLIVTSSSARNFDIIKETIQELDMPTPK